jgi:hypothetical protein
MPIKAVRSVKFPALIKTTGAITLVKSGSEFTFDFDPLLCIPYDLADQIPYAPGIICNAAPKATVVTQNGYIYVFTGTDGYVTPGVLDSSKWSVVAAPGVFADVDRAEEAAADAEAAAANAVAAANSASASAIAAASALLSVNVKRAASIAALKALTIEANTAYIVESYHASVAGGGGTFRTVTGASAGTYVDNGGTIILPTGGDGSSAYLRVYEFFVDIRAFGARFSTADNGPILNTMIPVAAADGFVPVVPRGTFDFSTPIVNTSATPVMMAGVMRFTGSGANAWTEGGSSTVPTLGATFTDNPFTTFESVINIRRATLDVSDVFAGVVLRNTYGKVAKIRCDAFYEGLVLLGTAGSSYNKIYFNGYGNVKHIVLRATGSGWCNSQRITIGSLQSRPTPNTSAVVAGILFDNQTTVTMNDNIISDGGYELSNSGSGGTTAVEFRVSTSTGAITSNHVINGRHEATDFVATGTAKERISTTCTTTSGSNVVVVASAANITRGASIWSATSDIPAGAYVTDISGLNVTISANATGSNAGQVCTILGRTHLVTGNKILMTLEAYTELATSYLAISGTTTQDRLSIASFNEFSSPYERSNSRDSRRTLVTIGRSNVTSSASGIQAPARGMCFDAATTYSLVQPGTLTSDEIQLSTNSVAIGAFVDVRNVKADILRNLLVTVERGINQGFCVVQAFASNGATILDSYGDVNMLIGEHVQASAQIFSGPTRPLFYNSSAFPAGVSTTNIKIGYGQSVAFMFIGIANFFSAATPGFKNFTISSPAGSGARLLTDSSLLTPLGVLKPIIDSPEPYSTQIPTAGAPIGSNVRHRLPAVGSPAFWSLDTGATWRAGPNL